MRTILNRLEAILATMRVAELPSADTITVFHASTPAHLAILLEHYISTHPRATAVVHSHHSLQQLLAADPAFQQIFDHPRIQFSADSSPSQIAILLHSESLRPFSSDVRAIRRAFANCRAAHKFVINGNGSIWLGERFPRMRRALVSRIIEPLAAYERSRDIDTVRGALELLTSIGRSETAMEPILVASRPMPLWLDSTTGSLHRPSPVSAAEEQHRYELAYHGGRYFDERRDWSSMLQEYQYRRWRNISRVVPARVLDAPGTALDVGCANGPLVAHLAAQGFKTLGIERADSMIRDATSQFGHLAEFRRAELSDLIAEGRRFDFITLSHVLEHIDDDVAFLRELRSLLAPGGCLYIEVPLFGPEVDLWTARPTWLWQWDHRHEYSRTGLASALAKAGWRVLAHADSLAEPDAEPFQFLAAGLQDQ